MSIGLAFWMLMIISAVFHLYWNWPQDRVHAGTFGMSLLVFILLFLLGWSEFGFVIQGGR